MRSAVLATALLIQSASVAATHATASRSKVSALALATGRPQWAS
jgi:hypothetical protein